mmetsp:Transcript_11942/g.18720  ORF Transcript_11942/g.18720 Transcript_11942/m.18720 type:complete len:289 (-) Transcript_11942:133-999(-)|eukprot:CAMPEP_0184294800 /NCGR_PEP_ID=MMETSP1049-20130417/5897_1 /TAXON_ID=77928 /ORGANISM="Proteomonas sulcata, Strain CCMP704" /LENGTH=288 /DNA_ID=CAMNT_0026603203 /DNA_START=212 /DNA_END=1078 /DNA_ORIENTATION=-
MKLSAPLTLSLLFASSLLAQAFSPSAPRFISPLAPQSQHPTSSQLLSWPNPCAPRVAGPGLRARSEDISTLAQEAQKQAEEAAARAEALKAQRPSSPQSQTASEPRTPIVPEEDEKVQPEDPEKVAEELANEITKLQRGSGSDPLDSSEWMLKLDLGREQGTWMDARWGASGQRFKATLAVKLLPGGEVDVVDKSVGLFPQLPALKGGKWKVEGSFPSEKLKFSVQHSGFTKQDTKCDLDLPEGNLFLSINTLGPNVGRQGSLSIEQYRFLVRKERRLVGVFSAEKLS